MANITMELVKKLREKTQVGMMDCKKALIETDGDFDKAVEALRKKGASVAAKRGANATENGRIEACVTEDGKFGALVEVSCETDFSANTDAMKEFTQTICDHITQTDSTSSILEQALHSDSSKTLKMLLDELIAKITENIKVSNFNRFVAGDNSIINYYIHPGSTLGAMIELEVSGKNQENETELKQLARDLCMQIAVTNPLCIESSQLDPAVVEKEKAFITEQLKASGKPDAIIEKIVIGKMNKYYEEVCLLNQKYIKKDKITIQKHIDEIAKATKTSISIKKTERFSIGK